MIKNRYCKKCGHKVKKETTKGLRKEYPYYCPYCDENMYRFETTKRWFSLEEQFNPYEFGAVSALNQDSKWNEKHKERINKWKLIEGINDGGENAPDQCYDSGAEATEMEWW